MSAWALVLMTTCDLGLEEPQEAGIAARDVMAGVWGLHGEEGRLRSWGVGGDLRLWCLDQGSLTSPRIAQGLVPMAILVVLHSPASPASCTPGLPPHAPASSAPALQLPGAFDLPLPSELPGCTPSCFKTHLLQEATKRGPLHLPSRTRSSSLIPKNLMLSLSCSLCLHCSVSLL